MSKPGLTIGSTYYISVDNHNGSASYRGTFQLCLSDAVDYDFFEGAIDVSSLIDTCSAANAYTTVQATSDRTPGSCWNTIGGSNRWFKFVASSDQIRIEVKTAGSAGSIQYPYVALWAADGSTQLACQKYTTQYSNINFSKTGLTIGNTYYISVDNHNGSATYRGTFQLCLSEFRIDYLVNDITPTLPGSGSISAIPVNGLPPYTYIWSTGSTQSNITGLSAGKYLVTVTDASQTIKNTIIYVGKQINWISPNAGGIAIQPDNQSLLKTDNQNIWGTGTVGSSNSLNTLDSNWVEFKVAQKNINYVVGIATNITDPASLSANYKIFVENNIVFAVEIDQDGNFIKKQIGTSKKGDVLRIELTGSTINYLLNGRILLSTENFPLTQFYIESDIYNTNAIVGNVRSSF
ncbi:MAG: hypothetical protein HYU69_14675 [Bacteroidetes bacterium]|nr:hypothetical protein [Bacteroidota bacterium]